MDRRLVTVASYDTLPRAQLAASVLSEAGIRSVLTDGELIAMDFLLANAVSGAKVQVWDDDAERAAAALAEHLGDDETGTGIDEAELARQALAEAPEEAVYHEPTPPPAAAAPEQPTTGPSERDEYARRAFLAVVFGLAFFPLHFYAIYLFLNAIFGEGPLSPAGRRKVAFGGAVITLWLLFWLVVLSLGWYPRDYFIPSL